MIGWLKGEYIDKWQQGSRKGIILSCNGIGYEINLLNRQLLKLNKSKELIFWVHQIQRDDGYSLYGFDKKSEKEIFRKLISVSGVGPQIALSLLEKNEALELVIAINNKEINVLTNAQGVGKRMAEKIYVELHNKLSNVDFPLNYKSNSNEEDQHVKNIKIHHTVIEDLKSTLESLGYEQNEINNALKEMIKINQKPEQVESIKEYPSNFSDFEELLKYSLVLLSQDSKKLDHKELN